MLGTFRAGQASVAATSAATICKPTTPCAGLSRSLRAGIGPGFDPQLAGSVQKIIQDHRLAQLGFDFLGPSALAFDPQSAIAPPIAMANSRLLIELPSAGPQSTRCPRLYTTPTKQKHRLEAVSVFWWDL